MKKTLLALVVAAVAASSANAAVIYQKDGTKVELGGLIGLEIRNEKDKRTDLVDAGGSRVRVRATQEIGGGFDALGYVELRFSNGSDVGGTSRAHRLYAGFQHKDIGTLTFGRQLVLGDHIPKANYTKEMGSNVFLSAHDKAAHFMSAKFGGVRLAADYYFGTATKTTTNATTGAVTATPAENQGFQLGAFYDRTAGDLTVRFGAGYGELATKTANVKDKIAGIGFDVTYGIVSFGIDWAYAKSKAGFGTRGFQLVNAYGDDGKAVGFDKVSRFEVGTKVKVTEQNSIYGQVLFGSAKGANYKEFDSANTLQARNDFDAKAKTFGWMLGVDHQINKNVLVYVEGGKASIKSEGETVAKNHRISVGTRIVF